jgi:hypothetical protein
MPANGRWDLIRRLKVKTPSAYIAKEEFSDIYTASIIIGSHAGSQTGDRKQMHLDISMLESC